MEDQHTDESNEIYATFGVVLGYCGIAALAVLCTVVVIGLVIS